MGTRQRKHFLKLFRKYSKVKKASIDWCDTAGGTIVTVKEARG